LPKFIDLTGKRFGFLVVIGRAPNDACGATRWYVRCDCDTEKSVQGAALRTGATVSCGRAHSGAKHGHSRGSGASPEYRSWQAMIVRCCKPNSTQYFRYGARGIKVCERWRHSFENFLKDMGPRPAGATIDRINGDGNYEPGNCRWANAKEQSRNRSSSISVTLNGTTMSLAECAERYGVDRHLLWGRLKRGWPVERAIFDAPNRSRPGLHAGSMHPQTNLTEDDIRAMRARYANGEHAEAVAASFGTTAANVRNIVARRTWKHVP
jgi:hypothetical protein